MNDTPRTNAMLTAILETHGHVGFLNCPPAWVALARELERELNAANSEVERLTRKVAQLYEGAEEQKQRIKHLIHLGMQTSQYGLTKHREMWEKEGEV